MRKTRIILFCAAFIAIITLAQEIATGFALAMTDKSALTGEEILKKADEVRAPSETFSFRVKLDYFKTKNDCIKQEFQVYVKDHTKSLIKFIAPAENKGRVLLMVADNMWIYIPNTHEPLRISPLQRLLGQVANADIARIVYHLDYSVKKIEETNEDNSIKLSLVPKKEGASYEKIELHLNKENYAPQKAIFLSGDAKPLKTMFFRNYQDNFGKKRPMQIKIIDEIKRGEESVLNLIDFKIENTPDYFFEKNYLKHLR
jgi:outer membrane lipoprotein-sorting protein